MLDLQELAKDIHFCNTERGFESPNNTNKNRKLLLVVSEICEAQEELRDGHSLNHIYYEVVSITNEIQASKPCGFPTEIADAIIRLLHIADSFGVPLNRQEWDTDIDDIDAEMLSIVERVSALWSVTPQAPYFGDVINESINRLWSIGAQCCDIEKVIIQKLEFNKTRPPKHGRVF